MTREEETEKLAAQMDAQLASLMVNTMKYTGKLLAADMMDPEEQWKSTVRRHVGRHLVYWSPASWLRISTVLRPENDPLHPLFDPSDMALAEGGRPYETAVIMQDGTYVTLQPVGPDLTAAQLAHRAFVYQISNGGLEGYDVPLLVTNLGITRRFPTEVAREITTRLDLQADRWEDRP